MASVRILLLAIAVSVLYGIIHDQITARICVEYFTIGHPILIDTDSPTVLGLLWGVVATWWVGAILGTALAVAARAGSRPERDAASLVRPLAVLMLACAVGAAAAGGVGHVLAASGGFFLLEPVASMVPRDRHVAFLTCAWVHSASYLIGFVGGIVVIVHTWRSRAAAVWPDSRAAASPAIPTPEAAVAARRRR